MKEEHLKRLDAYIEFYAVMKAAGIEVNVTIENVGDPESLQQHVTLILLRKEELFLRETFSIYKGDRDGDVFRTFEGVMDRSIIVTLTVAADYLLSKKRKASALDRRRTPALTPGVKIFDEGEVGL